MADSKVAGHCRHCRRTHCLEFTPAEKMGGSVHVDNGDIVWIDGTCPACKEGERIARWCDEQADRKRSEPLGYYGTDDAANAYDAAAEFARGES